MYTRGIYERWPVARTTKVKAFKSGNSVAIRVPKSWGLLPGLEFDVIPLANGGFELRRVTTDKIPLNQLYGRFSKTFMADGRLPSDEPIREWPVQTARGKAA